MASFIASVNGVGLATLDYGSGSPQEAAAFLAYLNAPVGNTTPIGTGQEWNDSTNAWQTGQLADGRLLGQPARRGAAGAGRRPQLPPARPPRAIQRPVLGGRQRGVRELGDRPPHRPQHDPATYIAFAKQFADVRRPDRPDDLDRPRRGQPGRLQQLDRQHPAAVGQPGVHAGLPQRPQLRAGPGERERLEPPARHGHRHQQQSVRSRQPVRLGRARGGLREPAHAVPRRGRQERRSCWRPSSTRSTPTRASRRPAWSTACSWPTRSAPARDAYDGADVWDLRNGYETGSNNSSSLYGWRQGGDYGLIGSPGGSAPATGTYVPYPTYFAEQLASKIIQAGGKVVQASSSDPNLTIYAVLEPSGHLDLLVINKSAIERPDRPVPARRFQRRRPRPRSGSTARPRTPPRARPPTASPPWPTSRRRSTVSGSTFSYSFPAYSMTVLDLGKVVSITSGPTITQAAARLAEPGHGKTTVLSVSATDPSGASSLTYTWTTTGTPPAPVTFSANGTQRRPERHRTFSKAGLVHASMVTVSDPGGSIATSSVTVDVNQTLTTIRVSPGRSRSPRADRSRSRRRAYDQFGRPAVAAAGVFVVGVRRRSGRSAPPAGSTRPRWIAGDRHRPGLERRSHGHRRASPSLPAGIIQPVVSPPVTFGATAAFTVPRTPRENGFQAGITITNTGTTTIDGWILQFQFAARIRSIRSARIRRHGGKTYVIKNVGLRRHDRYPARASRSTFRGVSGSHARTLPASTCSTALRFRSEP